MRLHTVATLLLAFAGCDPKAGSPFVVKDSPETRAAFERHCVDPATGMSELPPRAPDHIVSSKGGGCMVRLHFDEKTGATAGLHLIIDDPPTNIRARLESIVLPIVNDDTRRVIQEQILADVGADKDLRIERKGKGFIHYRHETKVMGDPPPRTYRTAY